MKALLYAAGALVAIHGLIHLIGLVAYWPLARVAEMPYKTTLLTGRWEVGGLGMKVYGLLWLLAALGFVLCAYGLLTGRDWWRPLTLGTSLLSTLLIALDWAPAFRGAIINGVILLLLAVSYLYPNLTATLK